MHTAAGSCCFFLARKRCCLWWWQAFMENIPPVPASDNRRVVSCRSVADGASRHFWRPFIIILFFGIFLVPVWLAVVNAGALNGHACTLLSGVWRVQKKGCAWFGAMGVQLGQ